MDLRREFPEVKIIAMSGGGLGADRTFAKPVEREELLKAVREVLGSVPIFYG